MQLDGLGLRRERLKSEDETWNKLTSQGVLVKPTAQAMNGAASQRGPEDDTNTGVFAHGQMTPVPNDGDVFDG